MLWIREAFFTQRYNFGKPVVFGHTVFNEPQVFFDYRKGHEDEIVAIGIDLMRHDVGSLCAVDLSGDAPVFYLQESIERLAT